MRALLVGLFALFLVSQAAAAAMQGSTAPAPTKAKVEQRALTLDQRLERKLVTLQKYRGTVRFFASHRSLLASGAQAPKAQSSLTHARTRVRQLTEAVRALRAEVQARETRRLASLPPRKAICSVFGSRCDEAISIARCESRLSTAAQNGQYLGLFQMGSHERSLFGHGRTAHAQAKAAHRYFLRSGRDWSPWSCRWAAF